VVPLNLQLLIPTFLADAPTLTETGYVGEDVENIMDRHEFTGIAR
jgi:ATP-dependent protease Clp ATPase subunit